MNTLNFKKAMTILGLATASTFSTAANVADKPTADATKTTLTSARARQCHLQMVELAQYQLGISVGLYRSLGETFARISQAEGATRQVLYAPLIDQDRRLKPLMEGFEGDIKAIKDATVKSLSTTDSRQNDRSFTGKINAYKPCLDEFAPLQKK